MNEKILDECIPIISIIVPVYNVEKYLYDCLDSIANQTINNYEVIIINDGSTDNSEMIIEKFVNEYNFMRKINIKNSGPGIARNIGINLAKGKYIGFVDSDDLIDQNMFLDMISEAEKYKADMIICDVEVFEDIKKTKRKKYIRVKPELYNKSLNNVDILKLYLTDRIQGFVWNKIYRRDLFERYNIRYEEYVYYEDVFTTLKLITNTQTIIFIPYAYYKYRQRAGSIIKGISKKHLDDWCTSIKKCVDFMNKNEVFNEIKEFRKAFEITYMNSGLDLYYKHFNLNIKMIKENYSKYFEMYNYKMSIKDIFISNIVRAVHKKKYIFNKFGVYIYAKRFKQYLKYVLTSIE